MLNIHICTIPHKSQRYNTIGDYFWSRDGKRLDIMISDLGDSYKELCVAVHELAESMLCRLRGIEEPDIAKFDIEFEKTRTDPDAEPGDDPKAPYRKEHRFAENIERLFAAEFGLDWNQYEETINEVYNAHLKPDGYIGAGA